MANAEFQTIDVENISDLSTTIKELRSDDIPAIILGPPGIGKSDGIIQSLDEGEQLIDIRASQFDPIDVRGVPALMNPYETATKKLAYYRQKLDFLTQTGQTDEAAGVQAQMAATFSTIDELEGMDVESKVVWSRPEFWPTSGRGVIVLEEVNTAAPSVQNTLLQPLGAQPGTDRYVGAHRIPKDYYWCATGNRKEDFAHVVPMSTAFRNRVMLINIDQPNLEGWTHWALNNGVHPYVVGYIRFKPTMLYQAPNKNDENVGFPTPRSWSRMISPLVHRGKASVNLYKGAVGQAAATEFYSYITELKDMPDIDKLLAGTIPFEADRYKVSVIYAIVTSLVARCQANTKLLTPAMAVIDKVQPEHGAIFVSNMLRAKDKQVKADTVASRAVVSWAQKHRTLIEKESR